MVSPISICNDAQPGGRDLVVQAQRIDLGGNPIGDPWLEAAEPIEPGGAREFRIIPGTRLIVMEASA